VIEFSVDAVLLTATGRWNMQEFPPPNWMYTDLPMPSDFTALIVVLIGVLVLLFRVNEPRWSCFIPAFLLPVLWVSQSARGYFHSPWLNPIGTIYVPWVIFGAAALVLVRAIRLNNAIVVMIAGLIVGLGTGAVLYPSHSVARPAARRTVCKNNLKQIGLAMHNYHDVYQFYPMATYSGEGRMPERSWRVTVLPFLDQAPLYQKYDQNVAWDAAPNVALQKTVIPSYDCPGRPTKFDQQQRFLAAYSAVTGTGAVFENNRFRSDSSITDGISNTLMVVETCGAPVVWSQPQDINIDTNPVGINLPGAVRHESGGALSSYHSGGANALLADGSVRFFSQNTSPDILKALMTRDGNELLPKEW
jgi:prepilin-type processing-associated H-X9-DG protein